MSIELMERALEFITGVYFGEHEGSRADREKLEADLTTAIQQAEAQQPATGEPSKDEARSLIDTLRTDARGGRAATVHDLDAAADLIEVSLFAKNELVQVFLVRDVASLLGASVPDVCDALAELGYEPRRSTNAAISPDEAIAVAKRINPAPCVPDDVALDAERWRYAIADGGNQSMNFIDIFDDWDGDGDFVEVFDAARIADKKGGSR